jgi:hypothetical protein
MYRIVISAVAVRAIAGDIEPLGEKTGKYRSIGGEIFNVEDLVYKGKEGVLLAGATAHVFEAKSIREMDNGDLGLVLADGSKAVLRRHHLAQISITDLETSGEAEAADDDGEEEEDEKPAKSKKVKKVPPKPAPKKGKKVAKDEDDDDDDDGDDEDGEDDGPADE